jgi:hypothetical protein
MKDDKNKPYTIDVNELTLGTVDITNVGYYNLNIDKIKSIKDIKLVLKHMDLSFKAKSPEDFEEMKHLLIIN